MRKRSFGETPTGSTACRDPSCRRKRLSALSSRFGSSITVTVETHVSRRREKRGIAKGLQAKGDFVDFLADVI